MKPTESRTVWILRAVLAWRRPVYHYGRPSVSRWPMFPRMICGIRMQRHSGSGARWGVELPETHAAMFGRPCRTCLRSEGRML